MPGKQYLEGAAFTCAGLLDHQSVDEWKQSAGICPCCGRYGKETSIRVECEGNVAVVLPK